MRFVFPEPGALEGVKSRSKVILRMNNVSFTHPTKAKPTIMDVSFSEDDELHGACAATEETQLPNCG